MSHKITGDNSRVVNAVQSRLNDFYSCSQSYEKVRKALDELSAQNVEVADLPAHEERYQVLLSQYKDIIDKELKPAAQKIREKTNSKHVDEYFRAKREGINRKLHAGRRNHHDIHLPHKEFLKGIHDQAKEIIKTDFDTPITKAQNESNRRKAEALSSIEFSQIDQIFPICREKLIKENPDEYLRQAALYQYRLLEKKDEAAVVAFGDTWIKNLPKEATWEQIDNMSLIVLEAAKKTDNPDLTEYRGAVEQWLKVHPLSENPSPVPLTPAEATSSSSRQTYVLGLLYLHNQKLDLSPEALQVYQNCSSLYPEERSWKVAQAFYHISKLQWSEAEQLLAGLPKDDPSVINAQQRLADQRLDWKISQISDRISNLQWSEAKQLLAELPKDDPSVRDTQRDLDYHLGERISSAVMDVGVAALSKFMPSSCREKATVDIVLTSIQLGASRTVRQMWVPPLLHLLGIPGRAISPDPRPLPLSSKLHMVGDLVDCAFRNFAFLKPLQSYESFTSYTLRIGHAAWTLKDPLYTAWKLRNPLQLPLTSMMNLGNLFISATQFCDAYQETRRPASTQAFLSTLQLTVSDVFFGATLISYPDLLPAAGRQLLQIGSSSTAKSLSVQTISAARLEGEGNSKNKWILGAVVVGALAGFRFYHDYPYLWAAAVMRDLEFYSYQGKDGEVERVLSEAEKSYFVSSVRPMVRNYALYANWLKDYPRCLEDPARCKAFLEHLERVLKTLKASSHYRGIRNNLLVKKIEIAIRKKDKIRLTEVIKEGPDDKIVKFGFQFFLSWTFNLALRNLAEACTLIKTMQPAFPSHFHPVTNSFFKLLNTQSESLQEWSELNVLTGQQKQPDKTQIDRWNNALQELQIFFSKNAGRCQDLEYCKLMIAFAQTDKTDVTQDYFEKSNPELHQRFFHDLVYCTRQLRKKGKHQEAISLLKRTRIATFKYNELIQNYGDFFSLLSSSPLQKDASSEEMKKLVICIAGLNPKDKCHQELRAFFESCRIVLSLDAEEYTNARKLLQEATDPRVPNEVAALLFERVQASLQANRANKGLRDLTAIIKNLGSWNHLELFKAYQAYLKYEPSLEAQLERVKALITQMTPIEQLSGFASNLQIERHVLQFNLCLSQEKLDEAKNLLAQPMPKELYAELSGILIMFLIHRGEQLRQTGPLKTARETLRSLNSFFAIPNSRIIQSYVYFLVQLETIEKTEEIPAHEKAHQSLITVFRQLDSIRCPRPESLKKEEINILLNIALLAKETHQLKIALAAFESIKQSGMHVKHIDEYIIALKQQLNVYST